MDAPGDLYTKAAGRDLVLAANLAGCAFVGRPLVEGTGDLRNFTVQARNAGCSLEAAYHLATADLVERVLAFSRPRLERPKLLALHASSRATSNTLALWGLVRTRLEERCDITEILSLIHISSISFRICVLGLWSPPCTPSSAATLWGMRSPPSPALSLIHISSSPASIHTCR